MGLVFTTKLICLGIQEKFTIKQVTQVLQSSKKDLSMRSVSMFPKLKKIVPQHVAAHSPQLSSPPLFASVRHLSPRFATALSQLFRSIPFDAGKITDAKFQIF